MIIIKMLIGDITKNNLRVKSLHCEYVGKLPQYIRCYSDIKDEEGYAIDIEIFDVYGLLLSAEKINEEIGKISMAPDEISMFEFTCPECEHTAKVKMDMNPANFS